MFEALMSFMGERFPLKVTLPLAFVLFAAPASLGKYGTFPAICGFLTTFLSLLALRICDDISDLAVDAIKSPERGAVSGRIDIRKLRQAAGFCVFFILVLNTFLPAFLIVCLGLAYYLLFFLYFKKRTPLVLQPLLVNVIFFLIPVYAGLLDGQGLDGTILALSLFVWAGVVAHDYAHSVYGPDEDIEGVPSLSGSVGAKGQAIIAIIFFLSSALFGAVFWALIRGGWLFAIVLACNCALIASKCVRLFMQPCLKVARSFYVSGFVFFIAPLVGLLAERLIGMAGIW